MTVLAAWRYINEVLKTYSVHARIKQDFARRRNLVVEAALLEGFELDVVLAYYQQLLLQHAQRPSGLPRGYLRAVAGLEEVDVDRLAAKVPSLTEFCEALAVVGRVQTPKSRSC